jgi:predicted DNA-binding protein
MGVAVLSEVSYLIAMSAMKGITIKLPEKTLRRLRQEARTSGRSVAALIRERVEAPLARDDRSVYAMTSDLAGSVDGRRKAATNARRKFLRA